MDTGIIQQESKLGLDIVYDVSYIDNSVISEIQEFQYNPERDLYVEWLIKRGDSTISALLVTPRKLSLKNTVYVLILIKKA